MPSHDTKCSISRKVSLRKKKGPPPALQLPTAMERSNAFAALVLMENNLPPSSPQQVTMSERSISSLALGTSDLLAEPESTMTDRVEERIAVGSDQTPSYLCGQQRVEPDGSGKN